MEEIRDRDSISPQLVKALDEARVNSNDLVTGKYKPARINIPRARDIRDTEVKPASKDEDDDDNAVEVKTGTAESDEDAGWYEVTFEEPFGGITDSPIVTATGVSRVGGFDSAEFEPPEFEIDFLNLIGLDNIQLDEVDLGTISVPVHGVDSRNLDHETQFPRLDLDLGTPSIDSDFDIRDPDIDLGTAISDIDITDNFNLTPVDVDSIVNEFDGIGQFSFEDELKEANRDAGMEFYDAGADVFQNLPSTPDVAGRMIDAWDSLMQITYGAGSTTRSGDGVVEAIWGAVGRTLDDILSTELGQRVFEQGQIADRVHDEVADTQNELFDIIMDLQDNIDADVNDFVLDVADEIEVLQEDTDVAFEDMAFAVEDAQLDLVEDIEDNLFDFVDDLEVGLLDMVDDINDMGDDLDFAIEDLEFEIEDLSDEIDVELQTLSEDINDALEDITIDLRDEMDYLRGEVESQMNSRLIDVEDNLNNTIGDLNDNLEDVEERVNSAITELTGMSEAALNESLELLYSTMGMPKGELMVPVQIRNVSNDGFEFLGYEGGTEINWTAIGRTEGEIEVGERDAIVDDIIEELVERGLLKEAAQEAISERGLQL